MTFRNVSLSGMLIASSQLSLSEPVRSVSPNDLCAAAHIWKLHHVVSGGKGEDVFAACDIDDPNLFHCRKEWVFFDYNIANWNAISVFRCEGCCCGCFIRNISFTVVYYLRRFAGAATYLN